MLNTAESCKTSSSNICREAFVVRVFGSRAKGAPKPYSDLDLVMKGPQPLTLSEFGDLKDAFSESDLPFKVDVVDWRSASPTFRAIMDRDAVEL